MGTSMNFVMVSLFCLAVGTVAVGEASAKKGEGFLSLSEAVKVVEQKVGSDVLSVDFLPSKNGDPYYRLTVDETPTGEKKDVWVDARTGKINQVIEHATGMVDDEPMAMSFERGHWYY